MFDSIIYHRQFLNLIYKSRAGQVRHFRVICGFQKWCGTILAHGAKKVAQWSANGKPF